MARRSATRTRLLRAATIPTGGAECGTRQQVAQERRRKLPGGGSFCGVPRNGLTLQCCGPGDVAESAACTPTLPRYQPLVGLLLTTQLTDGTAVVLDTGKFGFAAIREGLNLRTGTDTADLTHNIIRFVGEERVGLAIERSSAVMDVSNLPTTSVVDGLSTSGCPGGVPILSRRRRAGHRQTCWGAALAAAPQCGMQWMACCCLGGRRFARRRQTPS
jgi:hypothetical protein